MKRRPPALLTSMLAMLILLRSTRVPGPTQSTVAVWMLSFLIVLATLAALRFEHRHWPRVAATVTTLALLLIPPTPKAWLAGLPMAIPVMTTLWFLALLHAPDHTGHDEKAARAAHFGVADAALAAALASVLLGVEVGSLLLRDRAGSWLEWQGAWGPVLAAMPLLLAAAAAASMRMIRPRPTKANAAQDTVPEEVVAGAL